MSTINKSMERDSRLVVTGPGGGNSEGMVMGKLSSEGDEIFQNYLVEVVASLVDTL